MGVHMNKLVNYITSLFSVLKNNKNVQKYYHIIFIKYCKILQVQLVEVDVEFGVDKNVSGGAK